MCRKTLLHTSINVIIENKGTFVDRRAVDCCREDPEKDAHYAFASPISVSFRAKYRLASKGTLFQSILNFKDWIVYSLI